MDLQELEYKLDIIKDLMDKIEYEYPMDYLFKDEWQDLNNECVSLTNQLSLLLDQDREY